MTHHIILDDKNKVAQSYFTKLLALSKTNKSIKVIKETNGLGIAIKKQKSRKQHILDNIEQGLKEVKLMQEGKLPEKTLRELLEENGV